MGESAFFKPNENHRAGVHGAGDDFPIIHKRSVLANVGADRKVCMMIARPNLYFCKYRHLAQKMIRLCAKQHSPLE